MPRYDRESFVRTSVKVTFGKTASFAMGLVSACAVGGFPIHTQQIKKTNERKNDLFVKFFKFLHKDFKGGSFVDIMDIDIPDYPFLVDNKQGALGDAV